MQRVNEEVMFVNDYLISLSEECMLNVEGGSCVSVDVKNDIPVNSGSGICIYIEDGVFCVDIGIFCFIAR